MVEYKFKPSDRVKVKINETTKMMGLDGKEGVVVQIDKGQLLVDLEKDGLFWFWPIEVEKINDDV